MKNLVLSFLAFVPMFLAAQDYTPLVEEGAVWVTWYEQEYVDKYHAFEISGDTVIDEVAYKKVIYHELQDGARDPYIIENSMLGGVIREDVEGKAVYGRLFFDYFLLSDSCLTNYFEGEESLLLDFNYQVGDTVAGCSFSGVSEVNSIDSIYVDEFFGKIRRAYANVVDAQVYPFLIEGIGNLDGLFAEWNPFISPGDGSSELVAYCTDGTSSCNLVSSVWDWERGNIDLKIYPNPAVEYVTVEGVAGEVKLYDIQGRLVSVDAGSRFYVGNLQSGHYYLVTEEGLVGRFMKE